MCDRFFPDEPEYDIEILEWIVEEDYTDIKVPPWAMKVILEPDDILTWSE